MDQLKNNQIIPCKTAKPSQMSSENPAVLQYYICSLIFPPFFSQFSDSKRLQCALHPPPPPFVAPPPSSRPWPPLSRRRPPAADVPCAQRSSQAQGPLPGNFQSVDPDSWRCQKLIKLSPPGQLALQSPLSQPACFQSIPASLCGAERRTKTFYPLQTERQFFLMLLEVPAHLQIRILLERKLTKKSKSFSLPAFWALDFKKKRNMQSYSVLNPLYYVILISFHIMSVIFSHVHILQTHPNYRRPRHWDAHHFLPGGVLQAFLQFLFDRLGAIHQGQIANARRVVLKKDVKFDILCGVIYIYMIHVQTVHLEYRYSCIITDLHV